MPPSKGDPQSSLPIPHYPLSSHSLNSLSTINHREGRFFLQLEKLSCGNEDNPHTLLALPLGTPGAPMQTQGLICLIEEDSFLSVQFQPTVKNPRFKLSSKIAPLEEQLGTPHLTPTNLLKIELERRYTKHLAISDLVDTHPLFPSFP